MKAGLSARVSMVRQETENQLRGLRASAGRQGSEIAQERAQDASWGSLASKYGLAKSSTGACAETKWHTTSQAKGGTNHRNDRLEIT